MHHTASVGPDPSAPALLILIQASSPTLCRAVFHYAIPSCHAPHFVAPSPIPVTLAADLHAGINAHLILSAIVTFTIDIAAAIHVFASGIPQFAASHCYFTVTSLFAPLLPQVIPALDGFEALWHVACALCASAGLSAASLPCNCCYFEFLRRA